MDSAASSQDAVEDASRVAATLGPVRSIDVVVDVVVGLDVVTQNARSSTEHDIRNDLSGLAEPISASVETGALDNQCLQGGRVDGVTLVEIDGTNRLAVQTRVEEPFWILKLGPFLETSASRRS